MSNAGVGIDNAPNRVYKAPMVADAAPQQFMTTTRKVFLILGVLVVGFFGFGFILASSPDGKARSHERDVIAYCWQQQERKSIEPAMARFVAGTCEKLEADFRVKWNREP